jgi:hypothetical protein
MMEVLGDVTRQLTVGRVSIKQGAGIKKLNDPCGPASSRCRGGSKVALAVSTAVYPSTATYCVQQ